MPVSAPPFDVLVGWRDVDRHVGDGAAGQIREELGRRNTQDPLAPIDRDAVPTRFADQVRRYYETLGRDSKSASAAGEKGKAP